MKSAEQEVNEIVANMEKQKQRKMMLKDRIERAELELTEIVRECKSLGFSVSINVETDTYRDFFLNKEIELPSRVLISASKTNTETL